MCVHPASLLAHNTQLPSPPTPPPPPPPPPPPQATLTHTLQIIQAAFFLLPPSPLTQRRLECPRRHERDVLSIRGRRNFLHVLAVGSWKISRLPRTVVCPSHPFFGVWPSFAPWLLVHGHSVSYADAELGRLSCREGVRGYVDSVRCHCSRHGGTLSADLGYLLV